MATRQITTFLIDVGPSMREQITVPDERSLDGQHAPPRSSSDGDGSSGGKRTSKLQWCIEFVVRKLQQSILSGKKTNKVCILLFHSRNSNNKLVDDNVAGNYAGINELWIPAPATAQLIDTMLALRATKPHRALDGTGDALDALVVAITSILDKQHSGIGSEQRTTWSRLIYLITDGRSHLHLQDVDQIRDKLRQEAIAVRVMGVDFDTPDEKVAGKPEIVVRNEAFWHSFLADVPGSAVTSARDALLSARSPAIHPVQPVGAAVTLSVGPPQLATLARPAQDLLWLACRVYKYTALARPMARKELARLVKPPATAIPTSASTSTSKSLQPDSSAVRVSVMYDFRDAVEVSLDKVEGQLDPLPESVTKFRGYKLGSSIVPLPADQMPLARTNPGLEIICFLHQKDFERQYAVGEVSFVFADQKAGPKPQLQLSALVKGLYERDQYALARYVARKDLAPRLVFLWPECTPEWECLLMVNAATRRSVDAADDRSRGVLRQACFNDDVRRYTFPPLDRAKTEDGEWVHDHPSIPNAEQLHLFDRFTDATDLMQEDEDGEPIAWYDPYDSFSFNVQRVNEVLAHKATFPDRPAPPPHPALTRYMHPPDFVRERCDALLDDLKGAFDVRPAWHQKASRTRENDDPGAQAAAAKRAREATPSDLEEDAVKPLPTLEEHGPFHLADPVADFQNKLAAEPVCDVGLLLLRMQHTITHLLRQPLASREYAKVAQCIEAARRESIEQGESVRWNLFIRALKHELRTGHDGAPPQKEFWNEHIAGQLRLGLVTTEEDINQEVADVGPKQADEFVAQLT
ncbi:SPOC domain-like protein [Tilletiaria anomala UBC 951]|uniref:DNA helicase n=1 Tax=Tilletiaria anomala (strain ATCC 24038 / CBS 436.72 / UBC 951) TaxID=1037660 RepID=A0A066VGA8_TILAU|nr:SPOC domain-like protein [Tilletiaria anomala UBC 951]KDN39318.1 SPOC domain-like protein [Tilletiaria anomala UBC 951]